MFTTSQSLGIVVGVDGSAASCAALRWAATDAALGDRPLTLVMAIEPLITHWPWVPATTEFTNWQMCSAAQILQEARTLAARACPDAALVIDTQRIISTAAAPALVALSNDAELVVVGSRGRSATARVLLGSVSTALIHHAHAPVAVIGESATEPAGAGAPVLVGVDGSAASDLALGIAFAQASSRGVGVLALHAWSDTLVLDGMPGLDWASVKTRAQEVLDGRLAGWGARYPDVPVSQRVVCDRPAAQLIEMSSAAQLVVVGSHGRGGFTGMLLGSVSTAVAHAAHAPVIVARHGGPVPR